jgi:hypothetical protein
VVVRVAEDYITEGYTTRYGEDRLPCEGTGDPCEGS